MLVKFFRFIVALFKGKNKDVKPFDKPIRNSGYKRPDVGGELPKDDDE